MSFQLDPDTALHFPHFTIISASAGSGKTYTLTQKLLQLLLSPQVPNNRLRGVLAITFTNNAATEMRRRILDRLKRAALGDEQTLADLSAIIALDAESLRLRAAALVDTILRDYTFFQIQTIDSFLTRVFRASAIEFGFPPTLEVALNSRDILDLAFEQFARDLSHNPESNTLLDQLCDLLVETAGGSGRFIWNPYESLTTAVRDLYDTLSAQPKEAAVHPELLREAQTCERAVFETFAELRSIVDHSGLEITRNFRLAYADADARDAESLLVRAAIVGPPLKKTGTNASHAQQYALVLQQCEPLQRRLEELRSACLLLRARTRYAPYVRAYQMFRHAIDAVARREGKISLSDLNRSLVRSMAASAVPQIYLYLGDTIYHYLVDEFQDTAPVQWNALFPLLEEALAKQGSLFIVGDTKQSIYAFRHADWRIMRRLETTQVFASAAPDVRALDTNYRSGEHLVAFTKELFQRTIPSHASAEALAASGLSSYEQRVHAEKQGAGYVETALFERSEDAPPERAKILDVIRNCRERGFRFADITILAQKNEQVLDVSSWLNAEGVPFISHSSLDVRRRGVIGDVLALLRFLRSPVDDLAFGTFLLSRTFRDAASRIMDEAAIRTFLLDAGRDRSSRMALYSRFRSQFPECWEMQFEHLLNVTGYLPLYDLVCEIYRRFSLFVRWPDEESALTRLLETIIAFEQRGSNDLREFLAFADDETTEGEWSIEVPSGLDAVSVMTVHKAKGLDNRVVIVMIVDARPRPQTLYLDEQEDSVELLFIKKDWASYAERLSVVLEAQELNRAVDELNRLYVALTRAKDEMYVVAVHQERGSGQSQYFAPGGLCLGRQAVIQPEEQPPRALAALDHRQERRTREFLPTGKLGYFERRRGDLLHAILSQLATLEGDPNEQLLPLVESLNAAEPRPWKVADVLQWIRAFLEVPEVRSFFVPIEGRRVLNEQEIADADGRLYRMDRVVIDPGSVSVVDYKTGSDSPEYDEQVRGYMLLLRQLYPELPVRGFLAFIDRKCVREVA